MADNPLRPIFVIAPKDGPVRLVRASRRSQVEAHILSQYEIRRASQDDIVAALKAGVEVEESV